MASDTPEQTPENPVKYFNDQFDDEEVLFVFHKHPIVMRKGLVFGMFGPLIGILPAALKPDLGMGFFFGGLIGGCLLGLLIFAPSWIGWHFSVFIVTDQRFIQITQKGLFHRAVADLGLQQIQSVNYEVSGIEQTMLGFGTIKMQTYVGDLTIHNVHHPARIQKKLLSILREEGITVQYPASNAPANKIVDEETEAT
ncbi:MAG TPA: PH domain-containing protein [Verrucomicrobiae bacterium]|nr:PH domain-containing protein [Verrucomicrobiae bacterium]